jgi:hypothetical protein
VFSVIREILPETGHCHSEKIYAQNLHDFFSIFLKKTRKNFNNRKNIGSITTPKRDGLMMRLKGPEIIVECRCSTAERLEPSARPKI